MYQAKMYNVKRLRKKLSPLEDVAFTEQVIPLLRKVDFAPYERKFKGQLCVVVTPSEVWGLIYPDQEPNLRDLTILGRSLQGLLWERSYLQGNLVFTKTLQEVKSDGV
jgi:hypothetical protein